MKLTSTGRVVGLLTLGVLSLSACGSDNNTGAPAGSGGGGDVSCASGDLKGAGSTFQKNIVAQWIKDYTAACSGASVDYQGIGSGAGIKQFGEATVGFAGSDSTMKDDEQAAADARCGSPALHLPITAGGIAIAYNLKGVEGLQLSPKTIADIFQGTVKTWDAAEIKADNPDASLPSTPITAVHREDSSGTTDVLSKYLTATAATDWKLGTGKELTWPTSVQGAPKSDGVTQAVAGTDGGVTYVEVSFVDPAGLQSAKVKNGAGEYTELSAASVSAALGGATVPDSGNDLKVKYDFTNTTAGAYPISAVSYQIVCTKASAGQDLLKSFLTYEAGDGQEAAEDAGFAPLPDALASRVQTAIDSLS